MSLEAHSQQAEGLHDNNSQPTSATNAQEFPSREECIKSVASDYVTKFPHLPFADIKEPEVLLNLLHHLGDYLRNQKFDFRVPYQLEQDILLKDAKAAVEHTKMMAGRSLSEGEKKQRLHGWAGEMVVKFLLDVVYECARQRGVSNPPHRHHHNERTEFFSREAKSALHLSVGTQFGAGRIIRFDRNADKFHKHTERCEVDLLAEGEGQLFFIDVTTSLRLVDEKLHQRQDSPIAHLRADLAKTRHTAYNIVCAVTDNKMSALLTQDHEGGNYAGTVPVRYQAEAFAQRYLKLLTSTK